MWGTKSLFILLQFTNLTNINTSNFLWRASSFFLYLNSWIFFYFSISFYFSSSTLASILMTTLLVSVYVRMSNLQWQANHLCLTLKLNHPPHLGMRIRNPWEQGIFAESLRATLRSLWCCRRSLLRSNKKSKYPYYNYWYWDLFLW